MALKIWTCVDHIVSVKMQALGVGAGLSKENAKFLHYANQWLTADEARSNTARFGDLTPAIQAQRVERRIRVASPGSQDSSPLDEGVQSLILNAEMSSGRPLVLKPYKRPVSW